MIFGYSTNAFVKFSLEEALGKIADLGFRGVEIMGDRPHLYPPDYSRPALDRVKALLDDRGLAITNINSFTLFAVGDTYLPSWIEPEKERREIRIRHTLDSLEAARILGCRNISIPPGGPLGSLTRKEAMALFHQGLERVIPVAEDLGVELLVEPEPGLMIETTDQFLAFIKDVRSVAVGINFDIGHFFCAGEDPAASFETLFQWVGHIHLEDIGSDRVHHHLVPGRGVIQFETVFRKMKELNYQGAVSLELYTCAEDPEGAGRESLAFLAPIFEKTGLDRL